MRWKARVVLACVAGCAWLLCVAAGLELWETLRLYRAAHHADAYFARNVGNIPGMVRVDASAVASYASKRGPHAVELPRGAPVEAEAIHASREAYAALGQEQSDIIGTVEGRFTLVCDRRGNWISHSGDPLWEFGLRRCFDPASVGLEFCAEMYQAASSVKDLREPLDIPFYYLRYLPGRVRATPMQQDGKDLVRIEVETVFMPEPSLPPDLAQPEESSWAIPSLYYKKNHWDKSRQLMQTNRFGFKDRDIAVPKPPGLVRILLVGGSTVEEAEVGWPRTSTLLQEALTRRYGAGAVEVVNCGICGIDTFGECRRMRDYLA
jgi:hypothetical protein